MLESIIKIHRVSLKYRIVLVFYKVTFSVTGALHEHQVSLRNYQKFYSTLLRFLKCRICVIRNLVKDSPALEGTWAFLLPLVSLFRTE